MHQIWDKKSIINSEISFYNSLMSHKQIGMVQNYYFVHTHFRNHQKGSLLIWNNY